MEGRVGTVVGVLCQLPIIDQGVKGDGKFAWCNLEIEVGPVSVGSL